MKRSKERMPEKSGGTGCLTFLLIVVAIVVVIIFAGGNFKRDLDFLMKGNADVFKFVEDIKKSYNENMTYPNFIIPLGGTMTSPFGDRINPVTNQPDAHTGVDIDVNAGVDVVASYEGKIKKIGEDERFGHYIIIEHNGVFSTCYAHLFEIVKEEGDTVKTGEKIGVAGDTGLTTGKHLHFEIRKGEERVNPETYIKWSK